MSHETDAESHARRRAERLFIMDGLLRVLEDPHRFLDIMVQSEDETEAETALCQHFGLSPFQAQSAVNLQFWNMTQSRRQLLRDEADSLRD